MHEVQVASAREELHRLSQFEKDEPFYGVIRLLAKSTLTLINDIEQRLQSLESEVLVRNNPTD